MSQQYKKSIKESLQVGIILSASEAGLKDMIQNCGLSKDDQEDLLDYLKSKSS